MVIFEGWIFSVGRVSHTKLQIDGGDNERKRGGDRLSQKHGIW